MKHSLIVFLGSGLGGVARHVLNHFVTSIAGSGFPWGILMINVTGSTAIGLVGGGLRMVDTRQPMCAWEVRPSVFDLTPRLYGSWTSSKKCSLPRLLGSGAFRGVVGGSRVHLRSGHRRSNTVG
jgi:hypothetical protein